MIFRTDYIVGGSLRAAFLYDEDPGGSGLLVLLPPLKMTRPGSGTLVCGEIRPGEDAADEKRGTGNMKRGAAAIFNRILTGRCYKKKRKRCRIFYGDCQ